MDYHCIWIVYLLLVILCGTGSNKIDGIRLTNLSVPSIADIRDDVELSCSYNMERHKLNSVKWYKDEAEFFRYSPMSSPSTVLTFPVKGVNVHEEDYHCDTVTCRIHLTGLGPKTSGLYKCEVSGDAPAFQLAHGIGNLVVAALPRHDPIIRSITKSYIIGDYVIANCTSDMSSPPANLSWYIDNEQAPYDFLQPQQETILDTDGYRLWYRSLGIRFHLKRLKLNNSRRIVVLRCVANIDSIPWAKREAKVDVEINLHEETMFDKYSLRSDSRTSSHHQFLVTALFSTIILLTTVP